jgi:hypothetical protein
LTHGMACDTGGTSGRTTWALSNALMARVRSVEAEAKLDLNEMKDIVVEVQQGLRESDVWAARTKFNLGVHRIWRHPLSGACRDRSLA